MAIPYIIRNILTNHNDECLVQNNIRLTYWDLFYNSKRIHDEFLTSVKPNDRIGIVCSNPLQFCVYFFALLMKNATIVPINHNVDNLNTIKSKLNLKFIISNIERKSTYYMPFDFIFKKYDVKSIFSFCKNYKYKSSDSIIVFLTSGSTSDPKAICLTHSSIIYNSLIYGESLNINPKDSILLVNPLHYCSSISAQLLLGILHKIPVHLIEGTHPRKISTAIKKNNISILHIPPSFSQVLSLLGEFESVKYCITIGERLSYKQFTNFRKIFPKSSIIQAYGLTECSPRVSHTSITDDNNSYKHAGHMLPNIKSKIVSGELFLSSPYNYIGIIESGKLILNNDSWINTGDLASIYNNNLVIKGRSKNIVQKNGVNINLDGLNFKINQIEHVKESFVTFFHYDDRIIIASLICAYNNNNKRIQEMVTKCIKYEERPIIFFTSSPLSKLPNGKYNQKELKQHIKKLMKEKSLI